MSHRKGRSYQKFTYMMLILNIVMFVNMDKLSHNHTSYYSGI